MYRDSITDAMATVDDVKDDTAGTTPPTRGRILLDAYDIADLESDDRQKGRLESNQKESCQSMIDKVSMVMEYRNGYQLTVHTERGDARTMKWNNDS